jgi:hypothetical protein
MNVINQAKYLVLSKSNNHMQLSSNNFVLSIIDFSAQITTFFIAFNDFHQITESFFLFHSFLSFSLFIPLKFFFTSYKLDLNVLNTGDFMTIKIIVEMKIKFNFFSCHKTDFNVSIGFFHVAFGCVALVFFPVFLLLYIFFSVRLLDFKFY